MIGNATWIGCGEEKGCPVIHRTITVNALEEAVIEITGLGYFRLFVNGIPVSEDLMTPAPSQYESRDLTKFIYPIHDTLTNRIYYLRYDVTEFLKDGENELEILLGDGWYRQKERVAEGATSFGDVLKALYSLEIRDADGCREICSDGSETYTMSHILFSNLFLGEVQDAIKLKEKDSKPVTILPAPDAELTLQDCPPDRVIRTIIPTLLYENGKRKVYDVGENISGRVRLTVCGDAGEEVNLRFAEEIAADTTGKTTSSDLNRAGMDDRAGTDDCDGTDDRDEFYVLDFTSTGSDYTCAESHCPQIQQDKFISCGEPVVMAPEFVWHTFRYFEVIGRGEEPVVEVIHTDVKVTADFSCDNENLNWLFDAYVRTQLDSMHGSYPSDCPHRERLGYTGDGQVTADTVMTVFEADKFYRKWIRDILDCQDMKSGHVQHTAPFMGGGGGPGGWGSAVVVVPYRHFMHYGDVELIRECYPHMVQWIRYMQAHSENGLVVREEKDGWCLGDWAAVEEMKLPEPFANSCYMIIALRMMEELAGVLGAASDAEDWHALAKNMRQAVKTAYYDPETGSFLGGIQAADAHALAAGINADPRTAEALKTRYDSFGYLDCGFLGMDLLMDELFKEDADIALKLLLSDADGSFMWLRNRGATTIWEYLGSCGIPTSHCHPMFGSPVKYFFTEILGIRQTKGTFGFRTLEISPCFPKALNRAEGYMTVRGEKVGVRWERMESGIRCEILIPEGVSAVFTGEGERQTLNAGRNLLIIE